MNKIFTKNNAEKIINKTFKLAKYTFNYGVFCLAMNTIGYHLGPQITKEQAQKIINIETEKTRLNDKNISLLLFDKGFLKQYYVGGVTFSSNDTIYVGFDENNISASRLYHEIAHTILYEPSKKTFSLEDVTQSIEIRHKQNSPIKSSTSAIIKYIYSPEELFCNLYATYSVARDKIKNKN